MKDTKAILVHNNNSYFVCPLYVNYILIPCQTANTVKNHSMLVPTTDQVTTCVVIWHWNAISVDYVCDAGKTKPFFQSARAVRILMMYRIWIILVHNNFFLFAPLYLKLHHYIMATCGLCFKSLDKSNSYRGTTHDVCWALLVDRMANHTCTRCGKNQISGQGTWCSVCDDSSPYRDYPGPQ